MTIEYMDPLTGEILDEWQEGCLESEVPQEEADQLPDREWLPDHYMQRLLKLEAQREILQAQHKVRLEELARQERALRYRYQERLELVVRKETTGTRKRSVNYAYGLAGLRRSKRVYVLDHDAALVWAKTNAPEAVKVVMTQRLLKSLLPKTGDIPGVERIEKEVFYVRFPK